MNRDELVEAGARAIAATGIYIDDDPELYRAESKAVVDAILPLVTEAIGEAIDAKRVARLAEDWAGEGDDIADDAHEAGMEFAFRISKNIAEGWRRPE